MNETEHPNGREAFATRLYAGAIAVEAIVLIALWLLGRYFSG